LQDLRHFYVHKKIIRILSIGPYLHTAVVILLFEPSSTYFISPNRTVVQVRIWIARSLRSLGMSCGARARDYRRCPGVVKSSKISFYSPGRGPKFSWVVKIIAAECRFLFYIGFDVFILLFFSPLSFMYVKNNKTIVNKSFWL